MKSFLDFLEKKSELAEEVKPQETINEEKKEFFVVTKASEVVDGPFKDEAAANKILKADYDSTHKVIAGVLNQKTGKLNEEDDDYDGSDDDDISFSTKAQKVVVEKRLASGYKFIGYFQSTSGVGAYDVAIVKGRHRMHINSLGYDTFVPGKSPAPYKGKLSDKDLD